MTWNIRLSGTVQTKSPQIVYVDEAGIDNRDDYLWLLRSSS